MNTSSSKATVTLDLTVLEGGDGVRLREVFGETLSVSSSVERSQYLNRQAALEVLGGRLDAALVVEKPRRPTRVPRRVKEQRLSDKRATSQKKALRRPDVD